MRQVNHDLFDQYAHLGMIDVHNHDADYYEHAGSLATFARYHIDKTVLFGAISEPKAQDSDRRAWEAYRKHPDRFYPFFSGFPMHDPEGVNIARVKLEQGYYGIGETVAASTYSPYTSKLQWKAVHPMDGNLPALYELCAEYNTPILLHIDPPAGEPIEQLEAALVRYPDTAIIFAHANVFNPPYEIERLVSRYRNLYIDFFAGFAGYDPNNPYPLEDYIPVITRYPEQFLLSTDSATAENVDYEKAINAMYEVVDRCGDDRIRRLIARDNFLALIERQMATETQKALITSSLRNVPNPAALSSKELDTMSKRAANEWLIAQTMANQS